MANSGAWRERQAEMGLSEEGRAFFEAIMSDASPPEEGYAQPAAPSDTARFIADLTVGLSAMARGSGLDVLAYLLDIARLEAEEIALNTESR
jgi:hypothetical protein